MYIKADSNLWSGRVDSEDGELGKRWYEKVELLTYPYEKSSGTVLLGFDCDEGVKRNKGRIGAAKACDVLKKAMGNFAYHLENTALYDAGKVKATSDLDSSQKYMALHVSNLLDNKHFPIVLGGGHEVAYSSFLGITNSIHRDKNIAILNFDAHFDLRKSNVATSGTPFNQISQLCKENNFAFNYMCLGISEASNTKALFKKAEELHVEYILDTKMTYRYFENIKIQIDTFLKEKEFIYITIDTDVFSAHLVPAVSALCSRGIDINITYDILEYIFSNYKDRVGLVDIAEFNPTYDINDIGLKTIARLVYDIVHLIDKR